MTLQDMLAAAKAGTSIGDYEHDHSSGGNAVYCPDRRLQHMVKLAGDDTILYVITVYDDGDVLVAYDTAGDYDNFWIDELKEL